MKKITLLLTIVALVIGLSACSTEQTLTEAEAAEVVGVLSTATVGSSPADKTLGEELSKALTVTTDFTATQAAGGTAAFKFAANHDTTVGDGLAGGADAYCNVTFTNYVVKITRDDNTEIEYTINGNLYMEYTSSFNLANLSYSYTMLLYGTPETLSISGGSINTALDLKITNTMTLALTSASASVTYSLDGVCNNYTFSADNFTISATL